MKKIISLAAFMLVATFTINAQTDTMYIMKNGMVVGKYNVNTQVDSIIFYQPAVQPGSTFTDSRDGNVYRIVTIGNQTWIAENMKYLPAVASPATGSETAAYHYVYSYSGTNAAAARATANYGTYGVLYNWPAARVACPSGWHLPSDAEWTQLVEYLGGVAVAGGKLKEAGTVHWKSPNTAATNETGFTALPGGERVYNGSFLGIGEVGSWWTATEINSSSAWFRGMNYNYGGVGRNNPNKENGFSVRCVKD